jgi:hypothetical protein
MNLYHINKHNYYSYKNRPKNYIYIDLNNITILGDLLFIVSNGFALSQEYNIDIKFINNISTFNIINKLIDQPQQSLPSVYNIINEPREYFYHKILINDNNNYLIHGKYQSYKYFNDYIDIIKKKLFDNITDLIIQSNETFKKLSQQLTILVYINKDILNNESYYNVALNNFFINKNKEDYKILIFTENMNINNWVVFKNYKCEYLNGNEEKLFLLMIKCDHFIITNSTLPLFAYYFRNNKDATITFPPIWVDDIFNYNDMIQDEKLHISIFNKLNNTHIINQENRIDKKDTSLEQLQKLSYKPQIFKAHTPNKNQNSAIAYTICHIDLLLKAKDINLPYIVIADDDIQIINEHYILYAINEIMTKYDWNVIIIDENIEDEKINNFTSQVKYCSPSSFYIVNKNYYSILLGYFIESKEYLVNDTNLNIFWKEKQYNNWYTINKKYIFKFNDCLINNKYISLINHDTIKNNIIPTDYLYDIPIFNLTTIKELYNIHSFFINYKSIIINLNCSKINPKFIKYSLYMLTNNEYELIKLQSNYNSKTFNDKITSELIITKLLNTKIYYNNTAFLLNNNALKKIINKNINLNMGKLTKPIFFGKNDIEWINYYNTINNI